MTSRAMSKPLSDSFSPAAASILGAAVAINVIVIATSVCHVAPGSPDQRWQSHAAGCLLRVASLEKRDTGVLIQLRYLGRVGLRDEAGPGVDRAERVLA